MLPSSLSILCQHIMRNEIRLYFVKDRIVTSELSDQDSQVHITKFSPSLRPRINGCM